MSDNRKPLPTQAPPIAPPTCASAADTPQLLGFAPPPPPHSPFGFAHGQQVIIILDPQQGRHLSAKPDRKGFSFDRRCGNRFGDAEKFFVECQGGGGCDGGTPLYALRTIAGKLVCWDKGGRLETRDAVGDWERFEFRPVAMTMAMGASTPSPHQNAFYWYVPSQRVFISFDGRGGLLSSAGGPRAVRTQIEAKPVHIVPLSAAAAPPPPPPQPIPIAPAPMPMPFVPPPHQQQQQQQQPPFAPPMVPFPIPPPPHQQQQPQYMPPPQQFMPPPPPGAPWFPPQPQYPNTPHNGSTMPFPPPGPQYPPPPPHHHHHNHHNHHPPHHHHDPHHHDRGPTPHPGRGAYARTYYCGRHVGITALPGSNGSCGPHDGPQCQGCARWQVEHGAPPTYSPGGRHYYCGRRVIGLPGNGFCGPSNGPQCTDCARYQGKHPVHHRAPSPPPPPHRPPPHNHHRRRDDETSIHISNKGISLRF